MFSAFFIQTMFWFSCFLVLYTYVGYGIVLFLLVKLKKNRTAPIPQKTGQLPATTLLIAAWNEEDYMEKKIQNCLNLNYPGDKIKIIIITDGSDDNTPDIVEKYPHILHLHQPDRKGKIAAVNRAMAFVNTPIVIFNDANTLLNEDAILHLVNPFQNPDVGAVAGEKRIMNLEKDNASGAGEGIYWKYESKLKEWDSQLNSVVGAAGELFAIRTELFNNIAEDTIIEDFYLTLSIAQKGYKVKYTPSAYATEFASASVKEELKRKVRIAAGGIQAILRLKPLLNIFKYGWLSFQYISHRVLRWTLTPIALLLVFISNLILVFLDIPQVSFYRIFLALQITFYGFAFLGYLFKDKNIKLKGFFVPYYFFIMNYAVYAGFVRYIKGNQTVIWERAKRNSEFSANNLS